MSIATTRPQPHPVVWTILYLPFGALGGFIGVALTFLGTRAGLDITDAALLGATSTATNWLKWLWAPAVDITWTPKRWYAFATLSSALGVLAMSAIPLSVSTLNLLLVVIAIASVINTIVGMSIESIMAATTSPEEQGRVSAWFQAGNLGGNGLGGGLGLVLLENLPHPWMAGGVLGLLFVACLGALPMVEAPESHKKEGGIPAAVVGVIRDLWEMIGTRGGKLGALLCALPLSTGAAQGLLTQAEVAAQWGAGANDVAMLQGFASGLINAAGCFAGGWLCQRFAPRTAYSAIGLGLVLVALGMAFSPMTVDMYRVWNVLYAFGVGLSYSAFTAIVLSSIGTTSGATKYNLLASLSNFPLWWLGLLLAKVAEESKVLPTMGLNGGPAALVVEAALGLLSLGIFFTATRLLREEKAA